MAALDLDGWSLSDLKLLKKKVDKAIQGFGDRERNAARHALEAQAKEFGFSLEELVGLAWKNKRVPTQPKYRHPENPEVTWSGRGRKPLWFQAALDAGRSPESLAV